ncbi:MAG: hypothetical protein JWL69_3591 [Phycisphaerales bacterium]|nr:hypothetical protein [Phycisphaerales bacterium]
MATTMRILGTILAALSLMACLISAGAWVRSYFVGNGWVLMLNRPAPGEVFNVSHAFYIGRGGFFYQHETDHISDPTLWPVYAKPREITTIPFGPVYPHASGGTTSASNCFGFERSKNQWATATQNVSHFSMTVPCYAVTLPLAFAPAVWLMRFRRSRRMRRLARTGFCRKCGYDLRATPGRCPECGEAAVADASAASRNLS